MTKEEQIWRNSNDIAGQVFNLRNWFNIMKRMLDSNADRAKVCKVTEGLDKTINRLAILNRKNMDLTSKQ